MAVVVGTAEGKLTLDARTFITNIDSSYKALKSFYGLIEDTQRALEKLPTKTTLQLDTQTPGGSGGFSPTDFPSFNPDPNGDIPTTTRNVDLLRDALNGGLTTALQGVGKLAEITFAGFKKYTDFVVQFSKDSLQVGQQFDATMSQVGAISGAAGEDFDLLRDKAMEMGAQTKFSASEAAQAMVYMGMAGWDTQQIYDGLAGVMSLAAASGEDLATTSDIVTDALTAFGLEAKDAAHFSDVLAQASVNSNTNVALMGETFKYVAPLAGTMKYSIEDTAIAIGLMANSGIKGSQAGTALRNIISNLATPTEKVENLMNAFGISLSDSSGRTYDLIEMMQQLRTVFKDITPLTEEQAKAEIERAQAMFHAGEIDEETLLNTIKRIEYSTGSLEEVQAAVANTISGKYGLSGLLAIVNASDKDFQDLTDSIYGASEGMGAAADMEQKMMDNLTGSVTVFKSTLETFKINVSDILKGSANEIVQFGQGAIAELNDALTKDGIPGLIRAVGSIIPEAAKEILKYLPEVLPPLIDGFWALINGCINTLPEALPILVNAALNLFMGLLSGLNEAVKLLLPQVPGIIEEICGGIEDNADEILDTAIELFLNLVEGAIKALPEIIKTTATLIKKIAQALFEHRNEILQAAIDLMMALIEGLLDPETLKGILSAIGTIVKLMIDTFGETDWLETANKIFGGLGEALLNIFEVALSAIDDLLGTNLGGWAHDVHAWFDDLKRQSFEFGKAIAENLNKTEIELNDLESQYGETYQEMLKYYSDLVKQGIDAQDAMAAAYQKYFTSAEAQYVFRERYAGSLSASGDALAQRLGTEGMSNREVVDLLSKTTGNTYNFYSPEVIDEKKAADEIRKVNEDILRGQ